MERAPGRPAAAITPGSFAWRLAVQYVPLAALALAAFLIVRDLAGGDVSSTRLPAGVAPGHIERLNANIAFFEGRVPETRDNLSYNRLTRLYLQRVRETGDVSDIARAQISATKSLDAAPGDYNGLVNLALVRVAAHDFAAAATLAAQAVAARPSRADAYAVLGDAQAALGRYDEATESYRIFLEKAPGPAAFSRQATLAELRGNLPLAEQFWLAAIEADSTEAPEDSAWARVQLGNFYFVTGRLDDARDEFRGALEVYPGYLHAQAGLGRVAAARDDFDGAIRQYGLATSRVPVPEYVAALGDLYERTDRGAEAASQFAVMSAIDQLFEANGLRSDLTLILFAADHRGDTEATLARARAAYGERPSVAAADVYAWTLYRAGRFDEARARAEEALRLGTQDPLFLFHAGMIANAQGDSAAARGYLQAATDLNSQFSILYADETQRTLAALKAAAR